MNSEFFRVRQWKMNDEYVFVAFVFWQQIHPINKITHCHPLPGSQDSADLKSPTKRSTQKYIIEGLTEKLSVIIEPWDRLFEILSIVAMRCEWQMDKANR